MTNLLLRLFVRGYQNPGDRKVRSAVGRLSGIVGIVCNLLLFAGKLTVGTLAGSVSITADALNNLSDASSSIVTLLGFKLAERPADADHPYGHARFEYLSGLAVSAMIIIIGFELAKSSLDKIIHPQSVEFSPVIAVVLVCSILVKLWMALFNRKLSRLIDSQALQATSADIRNDCIATGAVLLAALVEYWLHWRVDGYVGLAVAVLILISGAGLARDTISPLLGEAASPELQQTIMDTIRTEPKVLGYHDLMVHDYGPGQRFASIHVEMDAREDPLVCHEAIDELERLCLEKDNVHLVIHYDPVVTDDPELNRLRREVTGILKDIDPRLAIHDFRMVRGTGHTNLIFDMTLPDDLRGQSRQIKERLDAALARQDAMRYYTVITFDTAAFNAGH